MLYVLLAVAVLVLLIVILLNINVTLKVCFDNDKSVLRCTLHYLWITYVLTPADDSKKSKKSKKPKEKTQEKKSSPIGSLKDKGLKNFLEDIKNIITNAWSLVVAVLRRAVLHRLVLKLKVVGEDAADTAIIYGYANSIVYPIVSAFTENVSEYREPDIDITPDFDEDAEAYVYLDLAVKIKPMKLIGAVLESRRSAEKLLAALSKKQNNKNYDKDKKENAK